MRTDCETIPDPHPRLETSGTVAVASQGIQPCGDELVIPGTFKRKFEGTQDAQAGSHELVVTGTVKRPRRTDCETIPDPHPRLETSGTVAVASQGIQPCGDELVVPGTFKGKFEGTQDAQAGSHEMVVTGVKHEAVKPAATAGLSQAGKSKSFEIANLRSDKPSGVNDILAFIAARYLKIHVTEKPNELQRFLDLMKKTRTMIVGVSKG